MTRISILIASFLIATASTVFADPGPAPKPAAAKQTQATPASARPSASPFVLKPQERLGLLRSASGLTFVRLAGGATMVDVQGRFRQLVVASTDDQGALRVGCIHDEPALRAILEGRMQAARARFEER